MFSRQRLGQGDPDNKLAMVKDHGLRVPLHSGEACNKKALQEQGGGRYVESTVVK